MHSFYKAIVLGEGYKSCSVLYCYGVFTPTVFVFYGPVHDSVIDQDRSGETKLFQFAWGIAALLTREAAS